MVGDTVNLAARLTLQQQTGLPLTFANNTARGAGGHDLLKIDEISVRGRSSAEPIYSWHPLPDATREAHDALLARILDAGSSRRKASLRKQLGTLAAMPGYPDGLAGYLQRRIDALQPQ